MLLTLLGSVRPKPFFPRRSVMKRFKNLLMGCFALTLAIAGISVQAEAQRKNDREVRDIVRSLDSKIDDFQSGLSYQLKSSSADQQEIEDVLADIKSLRASLGKFQTNLDGRRENRYDVTDILDASTSIKSFLDENKQTPRTQSNWAKIM